jgi:hypothetical protein
MGNLRIMVVYNAGAWVRGAHATPGAHPMSETTPRGFTLLKKEEMR